MRVAMIGATGLIGRQLWPLLERRHDLLVLGRRPSGAVQEKLGAMADWPGLLAGHAVDVAISTLGTTRKAAGSWAAFEAVDRHAVLAFAAAARKAGGHQFLIVSSSGADAGSRNAYLRLKGEVEEAIAALGFERVDVLRPGLLLGQRSERRIGEGVGQLLSPLLNRLLVGSLDRYAGIDAGLVATAMAALVERREPGLFRHHNREIRALAA
ncbi:NAD-dependent epimerase/dehydratase family protein [Sphingomonas sp. LHG3406-1]|uniref:NAD-dependent epimerase/dehydratase family protein n=1 Tax=Sphingomonas sp. LHG3406-1 TaxID=2804617 RepID=UPI00262A1E56|nr:NAD-dependent epimerase/dehydratase family protein [Sphingomonas sp. LHG3406-1]